MASRPTIRLAEDSEPRPAATEPRGAVLDALRSALSIEFGQIAPLSALLRAVPVVSLVIFGLGIGSVRVALTLGIGANFVAFASLVGAVRVPIALLVGDAIGLGLSTFIGSLTASHTALHLCILGAWGFGAGLLVVLGLGPATVGVQAVTAFVVFGRFVDPSGAALELGGLVCLGAIAEVAVLSVLRVAAPLRTQRRALATAYRRLAELALDDTPERTLVVEEAFDRAGELLAAPGLFGRTDVRMLRALLGQARRSRLEISALAGLRRRLAVVQPDDASAVDQATSRAATMWSEIADHIVKSRATSYVSKASSTDLLGLRDIGDRLRADALAQQCLLHLEALAGQLRAALYVLERSAYTGVQPVVRLAPEHVFATWRASWSLVFRLLVANLRWQSSPFRHAVRLCLAVPLAELIGSGLRLPRSYWVAFAVVVVLKPDYSSLFRSGLARVLGTLAGGTVAALIVGGLHPDKFVDVVLIGVCAWASYAAWPASFALSIGFITAFVLVLLSMTELDTLATAADRAVDIVVGGTIALAAYVLWPTWSRADAYHSLADLVHAQRSYLDAALSNLTAKTTDSELLVNAARQARLSWSRAESTLGRSLQEPRTKRIDADLGAGALSAIRRILQATHSLSLESTRGLSVEPTSDFNRFAAGLDDALQIIEDQLAGDKSRSVSGLRTLLNAAADELVRAGASAAVPASLDEIVDAIDTLSTVVISYDKQRLAPPAAGAGAA